MKSSGSLRYHAYVGSVSVGLGLWLARLMKPAWGVDGSHSGASARLVGVLVAVLERF